MRDWTKVLTKNQFCCRSVRVYYTAEKKVYNKS